MLSKICIKCFIEKELSEYSVHHKKDNENVYNNTCKKCKAVISRNWCKDNHEKFLKNSKERRLNFSEYQKKKNKNNKVKYYKNNVDKVKNSAKLRKEQNKSKRNKEYTERYASDPVFKISNIIRIGILNSFKAKNSYKKSKTVQILGCSYSDLVIYLESKFKSWMTWDNHGKYNGEFNYGWDIDHIIPISTAQTVEDIIKLNHYSNLQPLCSKINRDIKKDKLYYK